LALNTADVKLYASGTTANQILPIGWDRVAKTGDTMTGLLVAPSFSATTFSGGTYYGDGSNLTGITDTFVTGGTSSGGTLTLKRNDAVDIVISGISQERQILDVYQSGTTGVGGLYTDIIFDSEVISDSDYTFQPSGGTIEFNSDGYYEVNYSVSLEVSSGGRKTCRHRLMLDTGSGFNEIVRTASYSYHRNVAQGEGSASKTIRQLFNTGDTIKLQSIVNSGSGTLSTITNESNITINKISSS